MNFFALQAAVFIATWYSIRLSRKPGPHLLRVFALKTLIFQQIISLEDLNHIYILQGNGESSDDRCSSYLKTKRGIVGLDRCNVQYRYYIYAVYIENPFHLRVELD